MMDVFEQWKDWLPILIDGYSLSLKVAALALVIGIPSGLLLALGVGVKSKVLRWFSVGVIEFGRGAPALVLLQFMYFGLPTAGMVLSSFVSSILALAFCTAAYTSEIIRGGLESVPQGQREAGEALGFTQADRLRFIILPQGLRVALPPLLGFAIMMLQATSLCFTIALPELLSQAYSLGSTTFKYMSLFVLTGLLYAAICIPATAMVTIMEKRSSRGY